MGWDTVRHRPCSGHLGRSASRYLRGRVLVASNEISVLEPLKTGYRTEGLEIGLDLTYHTDLWQRVYLKATSGPQSWQKTIKAEAACYSAPNVSGDPPTADTGTWTVVSNSTISTLAANLGLSPFRASVSPDDLSGLEYVGIQTTVWQDPRSWSLPFEVVHELWANGYAARRAGREVTQVQELLRGEQHYHVDLTAKRKPFGRG